MISTVITEMIDRISPNTCNTSKIRIKAEKKAQRQTERKSKVRISMPALQTRDFAIQMVDIRRISAIRIAKSGPRHSRLSDGRSIANSEYAMSLNSPSVRLSVRRQSRNGRIKEKCSDTICSLVAAKECEKKDVYQGDWEWGREDLFSNNHHHWQTFDCGRGALMVQGVH